MLTIALEKVAHVIVKARELDAKVASWDEGDGISEVDDEVEAILESHRNDSTRGEAEAFIAGLHEDDQAELVALAWVGRGTFTEDEFAEAVETARAERPNRAETYLLGMPLLADYLEEGLDRLGYSVEDAEQGIL